MLVLDLDEAHETANAIRHFAKPDSDADKAADTIEALLAEVRRLREAGEGVRAAWKRYYSIEPSAALWAELRSAVDAIK